MTGNINILKLPHNDNGLSMKIIMELIELAPVLRDYIYVFDTPSNDTDTLKKLAGLCDGIVFWGGEAASSAVRQFAPIGVKLIEWGHKLSFVYISGFQNRERELTALAEHIMSTKQLLCSSCQVIYIDTDDADELQSFCEAFLPYLSEAANKYPKNSIGTAAEISLLQYTDRLERIAAGLPENRVYRSGGISLTACEDHGLELSYLYGNCLVKRLPEAALISELRKKKGFLQTAGLICPDDKRPSLTEVLLKSGIVKLTHPENMSENFCGEAHDGEYPLRRYIRVTNYDFNNI